jgi:hypothetical protein
MFERKVEPLASEALATFADPAIFSAGQDVSEGTRCGSRILAPPDGRPYPFYEPHLAPGGVAAQELSAYTYAGT